MQHMRRPGFGPSLLYIPKWLHTPPPPAFRKVGSLICSTSAAYRQKLKQEAPTLRTIQYYSDQSDSALQDCFDHMDWEMFRSASDNIDVYADSVMCFIKYILDVVRTKTIWIYPNRKLWINGEV